MIRHPNLIAAYADYLLPDGRLEDLSGNSRHLEALSGAIAIVPTGGFMVSGSVAALFAGDAGAMQSHPYTVVWLSESDAAADIDWSLVGGNGRHVFQYRAGARESARARLNGVDKVTADTGVAATGDKVWRAAQYEPRLSQPGRGVAMDLVWEARDSQVGDIGTTISPHPAVAFAIPYAVLPAGLPVDAAVRTDTVFHQIYVFDAWLTSEDIARVILGLAPVRYYYYGGTIGS